jgi:hypothetical protein
VKKQTPKTDSLIGKFFHTFVDGKIGWTFYDDADDWREAGDWKAAAAREARIAQA